MERRGDGTRPGGWLIIDLSFEFNRFNQNFSSIELRLCTILVLFETLLQRSLQSIVKFSAHFKQQINQPVLGLTITILDITKLIIDELFHLLGLSLRKLVFVWSVRLVVVITTGIKKRKICRPSRIIDNRGLFMLHAQRVSSFLSVVYIK